jgi:hypothetical protein
MARDLYGELLSRALNRGAPQGHFAAYITPQEGGALRAMGGGVAPGGGQFMANGIPSFQEFGGVDPGIAEPTGPTGGYGSAGFEMGFNDPSLMSTSSSINDLAESIADSLQASRGTEGRDLAEAREIAARQMAAAPMFTAPVSVPAAPEALHERAARNIERAINNPNLYDKNTSTWTEAGVAELGKDISSSPFAAGYHSPAATLARNNRDATAGQVAAVNQHSDRTGGYAVNDPYSGVSVPEGMNMGLVPAAMGTLAGLVSPTMGLGMTFSGIPTLGTMALDFARTDTGALGSAARGLQQGISTITNPINKALGIVTQPLSQLGRTISTGVKDAASGIGDFLTEQVVDPITGEITGVVSSIGESLPSFPALGDVLSQGETPVGAFQDPQTGGSQEVYVPPQPAPVTEPFVSDDADDAERQFAEIPPEILSRILANEQLGRQRAGLA